MTINYQVCIGLLVLIIHCSGYAYNWDYNDPTYTINDPITTNNTASLASTLLSDTAGPSFTLTIGTAANRSLLAIDMTSDGQTAQSLGYFSNATCASGFLGQSSSYTTGTSFTFVDSTAIYFGRTALSSLSANNTSTQCISLAICNSTSACGSANAFIILHIQNLTCNGSTCTGGNVCYTTKRAWGASSTPTC